MKRRSHLKICCSIPWLLVQVPFMVAGLAVGFAVQGVVVGWIVSMMFRDWILGRCRDE